MMKKTYIKTGKFAIKEATRCNCQLEIDTYVTNAWYEQ